MIYFWTEELNFISNLFNFARTADPQKLPE